MALAGLALLLDGPAAAKLLVRSNGEILVPIEKGFSSRLEAWTPGSATPDWSVEMGGVHVNARSSVADMAELADGTLLIIERHGDIVLISSSGEILSRRKVVYPSVHVEDLPAHLDSWTEHVVEVGATTAAVIDLQRNVAILASHDLNTVYSLPLDQLTSPSSDPLILADFWYLTNSTGPEAIAITHDARTTPATNILTPTEDQTSTVTALAICGDELISGHVDGSLAFSAFPWAGAATAERLRFVHSEAADPKSILDLGCFGADRAYSVTWDGDNGQVQLWRLSDMTVTGSFDGANKGHPGVAYSAVALPSASMLMSVGDFDVRLWQVDDGALSFRQRHFLHEDRTNSYSGAVLSDESFVSWDGARLWRIPIDGSEPMIHAGPPE